MTPRFIFKTKKWVSILIIGFGVLLLFQGVFPSQVKRGLDRIPNSNVPIDTIGPDDFNGRIMEIKNPMQ